MKSNKFRRIMATALAAVMALSCMSVSVFAGETANETEVVSEETVFHVVEKDYLQVESESYEKQSTESTWDFTGEVADFNAMLDLVKDKYADEGYELNWERSVEKSEVKSKNQVRLNVYYDKVEEIEPELYGITYEYPAGLPDEVDGTLPENSGEIYEIGEEPLVAAPAEFEVKVAGGTWKFVEWTLDGVGVTPNTRIPMVEGGLTFKGIWEFIEDAGETGETAWGVTYEYPAGLPDEVDATLPADTNKYEAGLNFLVKAPTAFEVKVAGGTWKFVEWTLNGVGVVPNTRIPMVEGGLTFKGIWEFIEDAGETGETAWGVTYEYPAGLPDEVDATLPADTNKYEAGLNFLVKAPTAFEVKVAGGTWKFVEWTLNGVGVVPNTRIPMVEGGLTFEGIWQFVEDAGETGETAWGVTYEYPAGLPDEVDATLPADTNKYEAGLNFLVKAPTAFEVKVAGGTWKFVEWTLNGVGVVPNTRIPMVEGGLTFKGIWEFIEDAGETGETAWGVTYEYPAGLPDEVDATLPADTNKYEAGLNFLVKAPTAFEVKVAGGTWKFVEWTLNGVGVVPNTRIPMVEGGLTFEGIWQFVEDAGKPATEYPVTYTYENGPEGAEPPKNDYTYSIGQQVPVAAAPEDIEVSNGTWKFVGWTLNDVEVLPNERVAMVEGGLHFVGTWEFDKDDNGGSTGGGNGGGGSTGGGNGGTKPVDPDPKPVDPDPTPVDPTPVDPDPKPVDPQPEEKPTEIPKTGDASLLWALTAAVSGLGLAWISISSMKRKEF